MWQTRDYRKCTVAGCTGHEHIRELEKAFDDLCVKMLAVQQENAALKNPRCPRCGKPLLPDEVIHSCSPTALVRKLEQENDAYLECDRSSTEPIPLYKLPEDV